MNIIHKLESEQQQAILAKRQLDQFALDFAPGDVLRVFVRVSEGSRTRLQVYEGVCIARKGSGINESFCVRKISYGEGVERVFPLYSPLVEKLEITRRGKVKRAKLYYLRTRRGKAARISAATATSTAAGSPPTRSSQAGANSETSTSAADKEAKKVKSEVASTEPKKASASAESKQAKNSEPVASDQPKKVTSDSVTSDSKEKS